jgi:hypothetical protein
MGRIYDAVELAIAEIRRFGTGTTIAEITDYALDAMA